jgi:hypothetical protein
MKDFHSADTSVPKSFSTFFFTSAVYCRFRMSDVKICQLCFSKHGEDCYVLATGSLHDFLAMQAQPTPFLYKYLTDVSGNLSSFFLCVLCDSWVRRQESNKKVLLTIDRFILSILFPGHCLYRSPEMRTSVRICKSILREDNVVLRSICPPIVLRTCATLVELNILLKSRNVTKNLSYALWKTMGEPYFLSNARYGKDIRCAKKKNEEPN